VSETARVRKAAPDDVLGLIALDPIAQSNGRRRERLTSEVDAGRCFVVDSGDSIAGYAVLAQDFFDQSFMHLLYVDSKQRRKGLATRLLAALETNCSTPKLFTSTNRSNQPMRSLLEKLGYAEVGVVDGLDDGDPEVFYLKWLSGR
jgi:ribosomal protein S18 acetylase RimI-like enzyme